MAGAASAPARRRPVAFLAALVLAALVFLVAVPTHLARSCFLNDTPYLPLCPEPPDDMGALRTQLREYLADNPGDSWSWLKLLKAETGTPQQQGVLQATAAIAPNDQSVLRAEIAREIGQGRMPQAVAAIVRLMRHANAPREAQVLAALVARGDGVGLLQPHLKEARNWLPQVLAAMPALKIPPGQGLPLVAAALERETLPAETRQAFMRQLKNAGEWLDAYGLWMAEHKQAPLLYNSGFDEAFEPDGFDWEFGSAARSRTGFFLEQVAQARRGYVLEIEFTGRPFAAPVLWQYVFTPPGSYRFRGDYSAANMKTESGLAWTVQCMGGSKAVAGRSAAIHDTGGVWKSFEVTFTTPDDCGPVARVQLGTAVDYEAMAGVKGRVGFDNFGLARTVGSEQNSRLAIRP